MGTQGSWLRAKLGIRTLDIAFVLLLAGAIFLFFDNGADGPDLAALGTAFDGSDPWLSLIILAIAVPLIAIALALGSAVDRRCSEDYVFQLIASASLVSVTTALFAYVIWDIAAKFLTYLRPAYGDDFVGLLIIGWAVGWFVFRIRGLQP